MTDEDALVAEMRQLLASLKSIDPDLDLVTADRLLAGRLDPADAPAGYAAVARLLAAAAGPASPEELAGEQAVIAEFAAAVRPKPPTLPRRASVPRLLRVKVAAVAVAAVLSIGGVVAAAGLVSSPAQESAGRAASTSRAGSAGHGQGDAAAAILDGAGQVQAARGLCRAWQAGKSGQQERRKNSTAFRALAAAAGGADNITAWCETATAGGATTDKQGRVTATGPDAAGAARQGLCRAWQAGKGGRNGLRENSTAFRALAAAAGGADNITAWCQAVTPDSTADHGQQPSSPPSTGPRPPVTTGPPSSTGHGGGQGRGGPSTTG